MRERSISTFVLCVWLGVRTTLIVTLLMTYSKSKIDHWTPKWLLLHDSIPSYLSTSNNYDKITNLKFRICYSMYFSTFDWIIDVFSHTHVINTKLFFFAMQPKGIHVDLQIHLNYFLCSRGSMKCPIGYSICPSHFICVTKCKNNILERGNPIPQLVCKTSACSETKYTFSDVKAHVVRCYTIQSLFLFSSRPLQLHKDVKTSSMTS